MANIERTQLRISASPPASDFSPCSLRARSRGIQEGAVLRLRPIMMTSLVATFGLLPAALSHGIGSGSQRPFAIVIVGGLFAALMLSVFLLPTLCVWIARDGDVVPQLTGDVEEV
jgi:cobalt-zinc-cadmium resistance protein CzcA